MRKLLVALDDDLDKELAKFPNQSEIVRRALRLYNGDITTESLKVMHARIVKINLRLAGIETAVEKIARAAGTSIDKHHEWGA